MDYCLKEIYRYAKARFFAVNIVCYLTAFFSNATHFAVIGAEYAAYSKLNLAFLAAARIILTIVTSITINFMLPKAKDYSASNICWRHVLIDCFAIITSFSAPYYLLKCILTVIVFGLPFFVGVCLMSKFYSMINHRERDEPFYSSPHRRTRSGQIFMDFPSRMSTRKKRDNRASRRN
ncbi:uncharacterized protein LOC118198097 [Stegodyphus dumicola]|uniref:uncharacterized protein LOC118198097 n=1 Tax=Stegodyphus dumicola TaxID=202533 RepID=UPI0015AC8D58|nr:uncharacterized protein LOC118198097 [Stegodyphus dumicola]